MIGFARRKTGDEIASGYEARPLDSGGCALDPNMNAMIGVQRYRARDAQFWLGAKTTKQALRHTDSMGGVLQRESGGLSDVHYIVARSRWTSFFRVRSAISSNMVCLSGIFASRAIPLTVLFLDLRPARVCAFLDHTHILSCQNCRKKFSSSAMSFFQLLKLFCGIWESRKSHNMTIPFSIVSYQLPKAR